MRQPATVLLLAATLILSALPVRSYTLQFTDAPNSVQVKWPTRNIKIALSTSLSAPQSNIKPGSDVVGAARRALAHWAEAANIRFITFTSNAQSISAQGTRGASQGTIDFVSGAPVFGANIWAEEAATGRVSASSISFSNGAYRMEGLLPGEYRVFAEPLNGLVNASEIASQRGAYASLALNQQFPFRAEEIGRVKVEPHSTAPLNAQLSGLPSLVNPSFIGINRELSAVAVPLVPGQAYKVFLSGEGIKASHLYGASVTTT